MTDDCISPLRQLSLLKNVIGLEIGSRALNGTLVRYVLGT
jgi:hypothetical protein